MHVEHICLVNGFLVISICIAYKCMFFFSNSDVSKNRRTVWLAGHLSLKSHGYHGILPKLCQSGSHCPKGGEFGTWFMWDIKKGFCLVCDLCKISKKKSFVTWFISDDFGDLSGNGIVRYVIYSNIRMWDRLIHNICEKKKWDSRVLDFWDVGEGDR